MIRQQEKMTALYCRLSRDDEYTSESMSIQTQKTMLAQFAETNGFVPYSFFVDDGFSGTNFDRPDFKRMIADIESGKVGAVIVKDLSRLGREYLQTGYFTEMYFPKHNVRFIAINDNIDSDKGENEFAPFKNIINEWYAKDCSRKIKSAFRTRALNGGILTGHTPYGYDKVAGTKNRLQVNENAPVVRRMFEMALQGISCKQIGKALERDKILAPRAYKMTVDGKTNEPNYPKQPYFWDKNTVHVILTNPVYTGDLVCLKKTTKSFKDKRLVRKPQDEWIIVANAHEALVSKADFETVQKRLTVKQTYIQKNPNNIFRGLIVCGDCRTRLSFQKNQNSKYKGTYRCQRNIRQGKTSCSPHYISFEQIEKLVLSDIQRHVSLANENIGKYAEYLSERLDKGKSGDIAACRKNADKARKRLSELDKLLQNLYEDKVFGVISEERYMILSQSMEDEVSELKRKLSDDLTAIDSNAEQTKDIEQFVRLISSFKTVSELDEKLVHTLIDKIVVHEREETENSSARRVEIYYRFIGNVGSDCLKSTDKLKKSA